MKLPGEYVALLVMAALILGLYLYTQSVKDRVIFFYHPSCGHCTAFKPAWEEIKRQISLPAKDINCEDDPDKCTAYGIEGYPTIILEKGGKRKEFNDKRTVENVIKFIES